MDKNATRQQFGYLPPKYNFSLNSYPEIRFSKCPDCQNKTGQRKLPLLIHIDPKNLIALNYTNRYCDHCDMLIGHKDEIGKTFFLGNHAYPLAHRAEDRFYIKRFGPL